MSEAEKKEPCRKCGTENPVTNEYCCSCGAVLQISTSVMKAQPKAKLPIVNSFQIKWVFTGLFVILGLGTVASALALFIFQTFLHGDSKV